MEHKNHPFKYIISKTHILGVDANTNSNLLAGYNPYCPCWSSIVNFPGHIPSIQQNFIASQIAQTTPYLPFIGDGKYFYSSDLFQQSKVLQKKLQPPPPPPPRPLSPPPPPPPLQRPVETKPEAIQTNEDTLDDLDERPLKRKKLKMNKRKAKRIKEMNDEAEGDPVVAKSESRFVVDIEEEEEKRSKSDSEVKDERCKSDSEREITTLFKSNVIDNASSGDGSSVVMQRLDVTNRHQEFWESLELNNIPKVPCSKQKMDEYLTQALVEILGTNSHITQLVQRKRNPFIPQEPDVSRYICKYIDTPHNVIPRRADTHRAVETADGDDDEIAASSVVSYKSAQVERAAVEGATRELDELYADHRGMARVVEELAAVRRSLNDLHANLMLLYAVIFVVLVGNIMLLRYCHECR